VPDTSEPPNGPAPATPEAWAASTSTASRGAFKNPLLLGGVVVVAAAVVIAFVVSGGSSPSRPSTTRPIAASPTAFTDAVQGTLKSSTISMSFSVGYTKGSTNLSISGSGGWNVGQKAGEFTESIGGSPELSALGTMTELVVGSTAYVELGSGLASELQLSTPWISTPLETVAATKATPSQLQDLGKLPQALSAIGSAVKFTDVGSGTFDGVPVAKYATTFNTSTLAAELRGSLPSSLSSLLSSTGPSSNVSIDAAVDAQSRLRSLRVDVTTSAGTPASISISITISSYDASLSYQAPAPSQVTPLSSLLGGTRASGLLGL
jgi:hypothetical protein